MPKPILRVNMVLIAAIIIMALPSLAAALLGWSSAASLAMLASMGGLFSAAGLSWRGLWRFVIASGIGTFLAVFAVGNPTAAVALMFVSGAVLGVANLWGLSLWNFMFPVLVVAVIAQPPQVTDNLIGNAVATGSITAASAVVGGVITALLVKKPLQKKSPHYSRKVNIVYTVNMAVLLGASGYFAVMAHQELLGMWTALTVVVILIQPYEGERTTKAVQRAGGTILGFLLAIGVGASGIPHFLYIVAGLVFLEMALLLRFVGSRKYWEYVMFLTPGVVLLSGSPTQVGEISDYRLVATALAATACLVVIGIESLLFWRGGLKAPKPVAAP